jgi:hypothetical protein
MIMKALHVISCLFVGLTTACTADIPFVWDEPENTTPVTPVEPIPDFVPDYDTAIHEYDGTVAADADNDVVGSDKSLYWEANKFTNVINVTYSGNTAKVESSLTALVTKIDGAYVAVDLAASGIKNANIVVSGNSSDGSLKIYSKNKFKLTLNGVQLESKRGPAINDQCKKRVFVHLADGTTNKLTDSENYVAEPYYADGATIATEDAKGCFFSEGHMILSGSGSLEVVARHNHGIAIDGYMWMRPGVTLAITECAKNAIHAKGSATDGFGVVINGGYIYANTNGDAGKCIKTDNNIVVNGGILALNCSGNAAYDAEDADLASSACLKSDLNTVIHAGALILKCTGDGARNINANGYVQINDGSVICTNTGATYTQNALSSSPKTVTADEYINIAGGEFYSYSNGRGLNADNSVQITGGKVYAYSIDSYSISAPVIGVKDCTLLSVCANADLAKPSQTATIDSGYVISVGNSALTSPDAASQQAYIVADNVSMTNGKIISLAQGTNCILNYTISIPEQVTTSILFSAPEIKTGGNYSVLYGGTLTGNSALWYELSRLGTHSDGQLIK